MNARGVAHGGVATSYRQAACAPNDLVFDNPDEFEVVCAVTSRPGFTRKLITVAYYLPPGMTVSRGWACLRYIEDIVIEIMWRYRDPFLLVTGDFNQWEIQEALEDFADVGRPMSGLPTRTK